MASLFTHLLPRQNPLECTVDTCDASESIIGYAPSETASIVFTALFAATLIAHAGQGIFFRTWSFGAVMVVGNICEVVGTAGRIMLATDPFNFAAFNLQICLLTLAPAFYSAGIYLQLKHLILTFSPSASRIPPAWYTYIFITCDFLSLVFQGAGGGLAASADGDVKLMDAGNAVMMTGLTVQVATLAIFAGLAGEYFWRLRKLEGGLNLQRIPAEKRGRFRFFLAALVVMYAAVMIRCIYRVVEMAGGWGNEIMRHETSFLILDPAMCVIASVVVNIWHPGQCFESRRGGVAAAAAAAEKGDVENSSDSNDEGLRL